MPNQVRQKPIAVDVAVFLKKDNDTKADAVINRELVGLLLSIDNTRSVQKACAQRNVSMRTAQRLFKRFTDSSGIQLLEHHGWQGTALSEEAHQCIALYAEARACTDRIVRDSILFCPSVPSAEWRSYHG